MAGTVDLVSCHWHNIWRVKIPIRAILHVTFGDSAYAPLCTEQLKMGSFKQTQNGTTAQAAMDTGTWKSRFF